MISKKITEKEVNLQAENERNRHSCLTFIDIHIISGQCKGGDERKCLTGTSFSVYLVLQHTPASKQLHAPIPFDVVNRTLWMYGREQRGRGR